MSLRTAERLMWCAMILALLDRTDRSSGPTEQDPDPVVTARELRIVDENGNLIVMVGQSDGGEGHGVFVYDPIGNAAADLMVVPEKLSQLSLRNAGAGSA